MIASIPTPESSTPLESDVRTENPSTLELSIVMPCLNEAETIERCIAKARACLTRLAINGEIVIADNGSTDGSQAIAQRLGARVVHVKEKGYGSALRGGIEAARGEFVIMGDADDSYDFAVLDAFVAELRQGKDLVMGNRFRGGIRPGAMPWKHRWLGNPVLTWIGRLFFKCPVRDFHCGLRGFRKSAFQQMDLRTTGMEFASEMVIKATLFDMDVGEVPTILYKDGRSRPPHLRSWRDGWRHLRFMLLFSPRWLFLIPGSVLFALGSIAFTLLAWGPVQIGNVVFDVNSLLVSAMMIFLGYQGLVFAAFTKMFAIAEGLHPPRTYLHRAPFSLFLHLEVGVVVGLVATLAGLLILGSEIWHWQSTGFGNLDSRATIRLTAASLVLVTLGIETIASSFFLSVLTLQRR
jgi:glycosyltransferase involved in cell wall biosynthesis